MDYPVSADENGVNFNPDKMEKEKLYHCIFKNSYYKKPEKSVFCRNQIGRAKGSGNCSVCTFVCIVNCLNSGG